MMKITMLCSREMQRCLIPHRVERRLNYEFEIPNQPSAKMKIKT